MPNLGLEVLFKGNNFARLLGGLGVALEISLIAVAISIPLGILIGIVMTWKNPVTKVITRVFLEIMRIMPQLVLLFIVFFGSTRALGIDISGELSAVIVFTLWGTAEMSDLVRGALISMAVVITVLPALLMLFDPLIVRTGIGFLPKKHQKENSGLDLQKA